MAEKQEKAGKRIDGDARDFLTKLTDSYDIDETLEDLFWAYASKDMVLSNFSEGDIYSIMEGFRDTVNDYIIQQPEHEFTFQEEMAVGQFEDWLKARLNRSYNGFERKMEATGIKIQKGIMEEEGEESKFSKLRRAMGGGSEEEEEKRRTPI